MRNLKWILLVVIGLTILFVRFILQFIFLRVSSSSSSSAFSIDQLRVSLTAVDELANLVHQRFQFDNEEWVQFFNIAWNIPEHGWDIIKYKIANKILTRGSFVMVFSGSSVTSGYGNHFNHSYPAVLYRRLNPLFTALGVKLEVRNVAHKYMGCRLMNYCLQTMGGTGFDFVGWEHSFDCGGQRDVFEFFARIAGWNKAVAYYSASGSFSTADCRPTRDPIAWTNEGWSPDLNAHIPYRVTPDRVKEMRKSEDEWFRNGSAVARFTQMLRKPHKSKPSHLNYDGVAPHGFNVWAKSKRRCRSWNATRSSSSSSSAMYAALQKQQQHSKKQKQAQVEEGCAAVDVKGDCYDKGGPHWMVQESSLYGADESGAGQQHHPSMALHLLRAEVLGYHYAHIIADAIYMIETDLVEMSSNISALTSKYDQQLSELQRPIPEDPWFCSPWECKLSPTCYTDYEPQYATRNSLSEIVLGSHQGWRREKVEEYHSIAAMGYLERRIYYKALGGHRHIHLMIRDVRANTVKVYGRFAAESIRNCLFFLDPHVDLPKLAAEARQADYEYNPTRHRFRINSWNYTAEDESVLLRNLPNGNHVLTLQTDRSRPDSVTSLSHVVVF